MWLAIAQPSSSMKCRNASAASRTDRFRARNGYSLQAAAIQIVYCCTLCKPGLGALRHCSAAKLCRLHVGEELTDLRASVVTPATRLIASAPTRASPEARLTPSAIDATALLKSRLESASAWDCVTVAKARRVVAAATDWALRHGGLAQDMRFDVVAVDLTGAAPRCELFRNAFDAEGRRS